MQTPLSSTLNNHHKMFTLLLIMKETLGVVEAHIFCIFESLYVTRCIFQKDWREVTLKCRKECFHTYSYDWLAHWWVTWESSEDGGSPRNTARKTWRFCFKGEIQGEIQRGNTREGASPINTKKRRSSFCFNGQDVTSNKWLSLRMVYWSLALY